MMDNKRGKIYQQTKQIRSNQTQDQIVVDTKGALEIRGAISQSVASKTSREEGEQQEQLGCFLPS